MAVRLKQAATLEACLAKVDCTGLEKSDYRKIGAKLRVGGWRWGCGSRIAEL